MSTETHPSKQHDTQEPEPVTRRRSSDSSEQVVPWYRKPVTKVAGAVLGITLAAGGVKLATDSGEDAPIRAPIATEAPSTPGETAPPANEPSSEPTAEVDPGEQSYSEFIDSFGIEASEHTSPEDITRAFVEQHMLWENAGMTLHYDQNDMASDAQTVVNMNERFDDKITSQLFTDTESGLSARNSRQDVRNQAIIAFWISQSRGDEIPYETTHELLGSSLVSGSVEEGRFVINADTHVSDNGDLNIGPSRIAAGRPAKADGILHTQITFVLDSESGTWKIDNLSQYADTEDNSR